VSGNAARLDGGAGPRVRLGARIEPTVTPPHANDGDLDAGRRFQALALPHADAAYNLAMRLARTPEAAEDIVQDAYVRALSGFANFRGGDARSWILTIVRNRFYDWARERKLKATAPLAVVGDGGEDDFDYWDPDQETPEDSLVRKDEATRVRNLIDGLPPRLREVIVLKEMEDLSYRQIAEITGAPIGTVMSRLSRARALLTESWKARGEAVR
jgi:RNA polymerase sigma factor (sigma-70 family)